VTASVIAVLEGADPQRVAFLALWHDSQETRTTDLPHLTKRYVSAAANEQVTNDQVRPIPPAIADMIRGAVIEYEVDETPSAKQLAGEALAQNSLEWQRAQQTPQEGPACSPRSGPLS